MSPRSILITGATSGIGRALALRYARSGVSLALTGRDRERLEETAAAARAQGAEVSPGQLDVRDQDAMAQWIKAADQRRPFDLVIANAGITTGLAPADMAEDPAAVRAIVGINLTGVLNTVEPLILPMCARGAGQIAFLGSIAGLRGLPYAPSYCATKAAVHAYSESLRGRIEARGVRVSLIIPGFVKTPLNDGIDSLKPLEISSEEAAIRIQ
ncbi:MAG: SDR family NAD(P)-dependent oxidoreductase, partial [Beijerinckiaceae bacterium]|nr:SDR family NAD(P)-dependent oxidoreductase [Beijerinckiaceae bacterium]